MLSTPSIFLDFLFIILESGSRSSNFSSQLSVSETEKETTKTCPKRAYSTAIAIARMACADCTDNRKRSTCSTSNTVLTPSFVRTAIFDLLVLCSSRVKWGSAGSTGSLKHPVEPSGRRRDSAGKELGEGGSQGSGINGSQVSTPSTNFSSLLSRLLRFIAKKRGYANSSLLLVDNCRWYLCEWIKMACDNHVSKYNDNNDNIEANSDNDDENNNNDSNSNNNNLALEDFPFQILDTYCSSYKQFLTNFGDIIFPLICVIENSKNRWAQLLGESVFNCSLFTILYCLRFLLY